MKIALIVDRTIAAPADAVFALALDPRQFPTTFAGCGPIPALRRITPHASPAIGMTRDVESSDGSVLTERITALQPPHRHAYTLSGLRPPLAWLVKSGDADWSFAEVGAGTHVIWRYAFTPTSAFAVPVAWPLLRIFMRAAMRRCLAAMARLLEAGAK